MIKFKLYFDKDKETQWLNEMSQKGWAMTGFFAGFYRFEPCEKGKYSYQIDFGNEFFSVSDDYREFMSDSDIEIIQSWGFWVFLRKLSSEGEFQLYTDVDSQIEHYKKIRNMFKAVTVIELICLFIELFSASMTNSPLLWSFVFLILAIIIAFFNITNRTNDIIHELTERKTGIEEPRSRSISIFLILGLLLNSCVLMIKDSIPSYIVCPLQLIVIVLMLVGVYQTARKRRSLITSLSPCALPHATFPDLLLAFQVVSCHQIHEGAGVSSCLKPSAQYPEM